MAQIFMFKYNHNDLPNMFDNFFEKNSEIHSHNTRSQNLFRPPAVNSALSSRIVRYSGVRINNYLKKYLSLDCSLVSYKATLKSFIIDNDISLSSL